MTEATGVALSDRLIVTASHALPANDLSGWDFQGKYTSSGAGLLRKQLDHLLFVYDGLDESRSADTWSQAGGRQRRVYDLTPAGRRILTAERGTWREFSAAVTALLEPAPRPVTP